MLPVLRLARVWLWEQELAWRRLEAGWEQELAWRRQEAGWEQKWATRLPWSEQLEWREWHAAPLEPRWAYR